eukprot:CAMPEP_0194600900 /NCGR_PEP_ID=MMETSP0292-20121207/28664_1 /TAXON_ID=39354 /ORGANISM="Heterosigma akashiwo, Strain CCMP2393" /LENGTH=66 /DNA_ID=CAMNT_0039462709 /DNA_START=150 /DNA_END=347 /DNA_ORIENTATION=+
MRTYLAIHKSISRGKMKPQLRYAISVASVMILAMKYAKYVIAMLFEYCSPDIQPHAGPQRKKMRKG